MVFSSSLLYSRTGRTDSLCHTLVKISLVFLRCETVCILCVVRVREEECRGTFLLTLYLNVYSLYISL